MRYLILGNGFMGNKFKYFLGDQAVLHKEKITSQDQSDNLISKLSPEWILNCAGVTGKPNVDWCEDHQNETYFGNVLVPLMLARSSKKFNVKMMHIGSGCIYEGDNNGLGFSETDKPNFTASYYSKTKRDSEELLSNFDNVLQLRLRMPLDNTQSDRNLLSKLLNYASKGIEENPSKIVLAQNSISYIPDFLNASKYLMDINATGIFNVVQPTPMNHKQLLDIYQQIRKIELENIIYCTPQELDQLTKARRSNCVLSVDKLISTGYTPLPVDIAMGKAVRGFIR